MHRQAIRQIKDLWYIYYDDCSTGVFASTPRLCCVCVCVLCLSLSHRKTFSIPTNAVLALKSLDSIWLSLFLYLFLSLSLQLIKCLRMLIFHSVTFFLSLSLCRFYQSKHCHFSTHYKLMAMLYTRCKYDCSTALFYGKNIWDLSFGTIVVSVRNCIGSVVRQFSSDSINEWRETFMGEYS